MNIPQDMFWKVDPQAKTFNINIYHKPISSDSGDGKYEIQKKLKILQQNLKIVFSHVKWKSLILLFSFHIQYIEPVLTSSFL